MVSSIRKILLYAVILIPKVEYAPVFHAAHLSAPLFTASEQNYLMSAGRAALSQARIYPNLNSSQERALLDLVNGRYAAYYQAEISTTAATQFTSEPQDPLLNLQWALQNHGEAQKISVDHFTSGLIPARTGEDVDLPPVSNASHNIIVAVVDTGVDLTHPDLQGSLVSKGWNILTQKDDTQDTHGHGTHLSGIIAAQENSIGIRGISSHVKILPVKVIQTGPNAPIRPQSLESSPASTGTALTENVARGILYAIQNGAQVINLSLAWPTTLRSTLMESMIDLAKEKNILIVASAGNDSTSASVYPCAYASVICVGAHGPDGAFAHFSNYGAMVDLLAPGTAILSTWPMNKLPTTFTGSIGYEYKNGTSMSSPYVAGALGELLSRGLSPQEAKSRMLASTRATQSGTKWSRFGNLDIAAALSIQPMSLIVPAQKEAIEILWNGVNETVSVHIQLKNDWVTAHHAEIKVEDQVYSLGAFGRNEIKEVVYPLAINSHTENLIYLNAEIRTETETRNFKIPVSITRALGQNSFPSHSVIDTLSGISSTAPYTIRSIVSADGNSRPDFALIDQTSTTSTHAIILKDTQRAGDIILANRNADQLMNVYRTPTGGYAFIFADTHTSSGKPNFFLNFYSSDLKPLNEITLTTETTVLSENFQWAAEGNEDTPVWISLGFTPKLDLPTYDPWNPTWEDAKAIRIYYLRKGELRTISLKDNQIPVQLLPKQPRDLAENTARVMIAEGTGYEVVYSVLTIKDGKIIATEPITFPHFRMFIGAEVPSPVISLDHPSALSTAGNFAFSGSSSPGNLRVTGIGNSNIDSVLKRENSLEALMVTSGVFADHDRSYFFVQSHYDLKFYSSSGQITSTSLNRYSYIPSMISNRAFFPTLIKSAEKSFPAIYIPASLATGDTSEIIYADTTSDSPVLKRLAKFKFKLTDGGCQEMGNLIAPTETAPAYQVYFCGNQRVLVPLEL